MSLFIFGDGLEVGVEWISEPGVDEILLSVVAESLSVELVLEVLKGERIVEDLDCDM